MYPFTLKRLVKKLIWMEQAGLVVCSEFCNDSITMKRSRELWARIDSSRIYMLRCRVGCVTEICDIQNLQYYSPLKLFRCKLQLEETVSAYLILLKKTKKADCWCLNAAQSVCMFATRLTFRSQSAILIVYFRVFSESWRTDPKLQRAWAVPSWRHTCG